MKLSVVIPCFNCAGTLPAQLEALSGQDWAGGWELIVVDNGSTDATTAVAGAFSHRLPNLRILHATKRKGPAYARNTGAGAASGDAILFCDGDDIVGPNWLTAMGEALAVHEFVGGRLVVTEINEPWIVESRPEVMNLQNHGVLTTHGYLPWASSSNMGIRRGLFEEVGGFSESMPALEDVDFCWRIQHLGVKLVAAPESFIHYRLRGTYLGIFHQSRIYAENFVLLCKQYQPMGFAPPFPSVKSLLRNWVKLLRELPRVHDRKDRGEWMWYAGWRWGCFTGSLKHRFFVP
jgi:glycosyltransferase involved in cell wall biosynthesis